MPKSSKQRSKKTSQLSISVLERQTSNQELHKQATEPQNKRTKSQNNRQKVEQVNAESSNESYDDDNQLTKVKIGKIPYGWYDEFKHFGYDNKLERVIKDKQSDKLQEFIRKSEHKDWWRTIRDDLNARNVRLTDAQLMLIDRIRTGKMASEKIATEQYKVHYDYVDPFPIHAYPPAKRNFMPSKWEQLKVNKILDGLLTGRIKWTEEKTEETEKLFDVWQNKKVTERGVINIAPMKQKLPDHNESYNPPKEYLLTGEELKEWEEMDEEDRPYNFVPAAYGKLRHVPFYQRLIHERFQRCLDLYLCPRIKKKKLNIDPDSLIPKLPDPSLMMPFPTARNIAYIGHQGCVLSICASPEGDYFATGDKQGLIIIWQTLSSRALWKKQYQEPIHSVHWSCVNHVAFSHGEYVEILVWKYSKTLKMKGQGLILQSAQSHQTGKEGRDQQAQWYFYTQTSEEYSEGFRLQLHLSSDVTNVEFEQTKGDYLITVSPDTAKKNQVVAIHRLSKCATQTRFIKGSGIFKKVSFYPRKAQIVILTQAKVVVFDLQNMASAKKLSTGGTNCHSCMDIHPRGNYVITGADNCKLFCYDLDLSQRPYKTMQFHDKGVTGVTFHKEYPLMASCSCDGTVHVFHFKDHAETLQDAVIIPLKVLRGHTTSQSEGVKNILFHPKQPWIFSVGYDGKVILWT